MSEMRRMPERLDVSQVCHPQGDWFAISLGIFVIGLKIAAIVLRKRA